jgi:hypothetical protein
VNYEWVVIKMAKTGSPKDITGRKFGRLTAIKLGKRSESGQNIWVFRCDCGVEKEFQRGNVLSGVTKSCGCLKKEKTKDITGQKFWRLTAIKFIGMNKRKEKIWLFSCDCGVQKELVAREVVRGKTKSCGCLHHENACLKKHGDVGTRLYYIWRGMRQRCTNTNNEGYKNYGGRGIRVCEEWKEYIDFKNWALLNGYSKDLTIDRKNTNGNYEPSNVRWATKTEQTRNRRNTLWYEIDGIKKPLVEWCEIFNISLDTVNGRLHRGRSPFFDEYNETRVYI